jgi:ParB family chromosome partitioning protein
VRSAEKIAFGASLKKPHVEKSAPVPTKRDPHLSAIEEKFIELLGTKVAIEGDFNHGVIRVEYYSMQDLDRLYEILIRQ